MIGSANHEPPLHAFSSNLLTIPPSYTHTFSLQRETSYNIHTKQVRQFSFCNRARFMIYILKNQLFFALKYTLKHSLIKTISTPTCFGLIRPSSGRCRAWLLSYLVKLFRIIIRNNVAMVNLKSFF